MTSSSTVLGDVLERFYVLSSIELAAVVGSDGLLIDSSTGPGPEVDAISAVASNGLAMAEALGREIDKGSTLQAIMEYEAGLILLEPISAEAMLLLLINAPEELGQLRFLVALHRDELLEALESI